MKLLSLISFIVWDLQFVGKIQAIEVGFSYVGVQKKINYIPRTNTGKECMTVE